MHLSDHKVQITIRNEAINKLLLANYILINKLKESGCDDGVPRYVMSCDDLSDDLRSIIDPKLHAFKSIRCT